MAWAGPPDNTRIYFNRRRVANGVFDGWSAKPDGSDEVCHTDISAYPATTHAGIGDVTADGKYALVTVERSNHWPISDGDLMGSPGRGVYNNLWLQEISTGRAWKLRDIVTSKGNSLIWPRFDTTGKRVAWAELVIPALWPGVIGGLGEWRMHVANINMSTKKLENIKTKLTKGLMEPYGFSADGSKVLFAGDKIVGKEFDATAICEMSSDLVGPATQLSPNEPSGWWNNYNEFAYWIPGTGESKIIFSRKTGTTNGLEYWTMNSDGSGAEQLTFFSSQGFVSIAGGLAFNPNDPKEFVAGFALDGADSYTSMMLRL